MRDGMCGRSRRRVDVTGIAAVSSTSIWLVGYAARDRATLAEHWDGVRWSYVASPNEDPDRNVLNCVTTLGDDSVWAAGRAGGEHETSRGRVPTTSSMRTLVEYWDGTGWSVQESPNPSDQDVVTSCDAVPTTDVWAVGTGQSTTRQRSVNDYLHSNGARWSSVKGPLPPSRVASLDSVSADSRGDAWAVGSYFDGAGYHMMAEHWNGQTWTEQ
jgi:hypothetical protein